MPVKPIATEPGLWKCTTLHDQTCSCVHRYRRRKFENLLWNV